MEKFKQMKPAGEQGFYLLEKENGKWTLAFGTSIVTSKEFETEEELNNYFAHLPWDVMMNVSMLLYKLIKEEEKNENDREAKNAN